MSARVAVIAQARMGSSRLPGKVLETIGGRSVVAHVLSRIKSIPGVDVVCCATTTDPSDDAVAAEVARTGSAVYRGSAEDVLNRYAQAAALLNASVIMRITCDCPLLDAAVCGEVIRLREAQGADYAANNLVASWPHGLDCEVFTIKTLQDAHAAARTRHEHEHVTPWMRKNPALRKANLKGPGGDAATMRWTLDYPEDLSFFRALNAVSGLETLTHWQDTLSLLRAHPELLSINRIRAGESRPATSAAQVP
jgi:spore coat polysaccharide biosynthesis protein SpsF